MGRIEALWLTTFRCYRDAHVSFAPGVTVIGGGNGEGKTSLLEAVHWIATARSFRGVPSRALVHTQAEQAILRASLVSGERHQSVEAELHVAGRDRVLVNRQPLRRARDLLGVLRVSVFAPDDLALVKAGPALRREYLDDLLVAITPRYEGVRRDLDKVLKHRNALLRRGVRDAADRTTLDVFDAQLVAAGAQLATGRLQLIDGLLPLVRDAYDDLTSGGCKVDATYRADWRDRDRHGEGASDDVEAGLRTALHRSRSDEIDRRMSLVGPHRDDWELGIDGLDARQHASQGEQRTLALALRLGGHRCVARSTGDEPVLLLDDVFSELDAARSQALVAHLPRSQTLVTTAVGLPEGVDPDLHLEVRDGRVGPAG